jgi:hypothetical protein
MGAEFSGVGVQGMAFRCAETQLPRNWGTASSLDRWISGVAAEGQSKPPTVLRRSAAFCEGLAAGGWISQPHRCGATLWAQ